MNKLRKSKINKTSQKKQNISWLAIFILIIFILFVILMNLPSDFFKEKRKANFPAKYEQKFKKEGELTFFTESDVDILSIDIEIAESNKERALGLMYRNSMPYTHGMFFIMDKYEMQSFWMKNTFISLDIIYLDEELRIIKIHRNTVPLSTDHVFSEDKAKYVLEVSAGFCKKYKIKEGDFIKYSRV